MFPLIEVPHDAADLHEQLGTKPKFWYGNGCFLFKEARANSGEDWSEKVTAELCLLLGLPHANYDLALWRGRRGVVSETFVPQHARLIHGNELLAKYVAEYPKTRFYRVRQHTVRRALAVLRNIQPPIGLADPTTLQTGADVFVGYLMLDAWVANQDRHHENWGVIHTREGTVHLAPSFDHASSLGRNEPDEVRRDRLTTKDRKRSMEHYVEKAMSAFYFSEGSNKPLSTLDAFIHAAKLFPRSGLLWLKRLETVPSKEVENIFNQISADRISETATTFALRMLELNKRRLLDAVHKVMA